MTVAIRSARATRDFPGTRPLTERLYSRARAA
jgi:hypothetical protein